MWIWLERIRNKPDGFRQRLAFAGALSATSVIALVWLVSLPERYNVPDKTTVEPEQTDSGLGLEKLREGWGEQLANIKEALQDPTEETLVNATTTETTMDVTNTDPKPEFIWADSTSDKKDESATKTSRTILIATSSASSTKQ